MVQYADGPTSKSKLRYCITAVKKPDWQREVGLTFGTFAVFRVGRLAAVTRAEAAVDGRFSRTGRRDNRGTASRSVSSLRPRQRDKGRRNGLRSNDDHQGSAQDGCPCTRKATGLELASCGSPWQDPFKGVRSVVSSTRLRLTTAFNFHAATTTCPCSEKLVSLVWI